MPPKHAPFPGDRQFWLPIALAVCFVYGLLLLALIHTTADGSWFWYAQALRHGRHLYRDLHLPLQPVYPMELAALQRAFGIGWLSQQTAGLLNLLVFLAALLLVANQLPVPRWQRALLLTCAFVTCMGFIMMRFDDYHVLAASLELLCATLLLRLPRGVSRAQRQATLVALGALCGVCLLTRINDGALLLCAVLFCIAFLQTGKGIVRFSGVALLLAAATATVLAVLAALGETPQVWWFYTVHTAAAIKGGSGHLWWYPLRLPLGTVRELTRDWRTLALTLYALVVGGVAFVLASRGQRMPARRIWLLVALAVLPAFPLARNIVRGNAGRVLVAFTVFFIYGLAIVTVVRLVQALRGRPAAGWSNRELILLLPFAQLVSIALSAARWYPNTNPPAALFLLLLPVAAPRIVAPPGRRAVFLTWAALLTVSAGIDKLRNPFDWFNYRARSFDAPRTWYRNPALGPMLIETEQLRLVQPVCQAVDTRPPAQRELLSLPFTFPNYFCNVPPWHGYTQTFYDTSSRATIAALQHDLLTAPPEWIVYQRQLDVLSRNEEAFNNAQPLPHRDLDRLLMEQVATHRWSAVALPAPARDTSTWLLLHTRP